MYLSRIPLDTTRRSTMKALVSPNLFHGAIEQSFPGPRKRNLWRIDKLHEKTYLLVLSQERPDFSRVADQFGNTGNENVWECRPYEPLLNRIEPLDVWHFRLTANPVISKSAGQDNRGRILGHVTPEYQKKWLMDRAEKHGFLLCEEGFSVVESRWLRFRKGTDGGRSVTLLSVTYEGMLTVTDSEAIVHTLIEGLGRGKAYGLGLLTIAGKVRSV